jgi:hypothetical protein
MIVPETEKTIISSGISNVQEYKILANSKMMNILSNNIYSNKVRAVMRELSTNAYDSHVSAGKKEVPFDVYLPTESNTEFKIRDYGTGLCPEDVIQLYSTYGSSNKTNSNEFVGFMGLGSKSPFSVVSSFTTISYFNGKKYTFLNFKNEQDIPSISLISTTDTDQPNGLEISFLVSKELCVKFLTELDYVFHPFDVTPNVYMSKTGTFFSSSGYTKLDLAKEVIDLNGLKIVFSNTSKHFKSSYSYYSGLFIKMGNVFYDAPRELTQNTGFCSFEFSNSLNLKNKEFVPFRAYIEVDIGDIDISTSREEVQKTNRTEKAINSWLETFFSKRTKVIEDIYKNSAIDIEKCTKLNVLPEKYLQANFFKKWIENSPSRDKSIEINLDDFSDRRHFNFAVVNRTYEDSFTKSGKEWNLLKLPDMKIFSTGLSKDDKRIRQHEEIVDYTPNFFTIKYSASSYNKKYFSRKARVKNVLIIHRDETRYLDKINSIVDDYSAVITVTSAEDAKKCEDFFVGAQYFNFETMKVSEIKIEKTPRQKTPKKDYEYGFLSINGNHPVQVTETEIESSMKDGDTILYLLMQGRSTKIFKSENNSLELNRETIETSLRYKDTEKFFEFISGILAIKPCNLFKNILLIPEGRKDKLVETLFKNKKIKAVNLFTFLEINSAKLASYKAHQHYFYNDFTGSNVYLENEEVLELSKMSGKKYDKLTEFAKIHSEAELWNSEIPFYRNFVDISLSDQLLNDLRADSQLKSEVTDLLKFRTKRRYVNVITKELQRNFINFNTDSSEFVDFKKYLLSL